MPNPDGTLTFAELFNCSITAFKLRLRPLLIIGFAGTVITVLPLLLFVMTNSVGLMSLLQIVAVILGIILHIMLWNVAVNGTQDLQATFKAGVSKFFPYIGLTIWMGLRSFGWIVVIPLLLIFVASAMQSTALMVLGGFLLLLSFIPVIVLAPRFITSQVIFFRDCKRVTESVERSYRSTRGYWGKIVGNMLLLMVCVWAVSIGLSFSINLFSGGSMLFANSNGVSPGNLSATFLIGSFLGAVIQMLIGITVMLFTVELSMTILQHPKA